jgi:hypothetical protein
VDDARQDGRQLESFEPDLIQYLIVGVPDRTAVRQLLTALSRLVLAGTVRLLDVVMLTKDELGAIDVVTVDELDELADDVQIHREAPGLLTGHDLELASFSLPPSSAGLVVVTEDRWAEPLSSAAKQAGGRIAAGELVPPQRVGAALNEGTEDLLARPPFGHREVASGWDKMLVDPVEQLKTLDELRRTGVLSDEEFTRQKDKIVGGS